MCERVILFPLHKYLTKKRAMKAKKERTLEEPTIYFRP
jgi:hypothetical protein